MNDRKAEAMRGIAADVALYFVRVRTVKDEAKAFRKRKSAQEEYHRLIMSDGSS